MAELYVLPAKMSSDSTVRLTTMLAEAYAEGADLGPRGPHIRALGASLEQLSHVLRQAAEEIISLSDTIHPEKEATQAALGDLIDQVERLVVAARVYPT